MATSKALSNMIDLWERLHPIFDTDVGDYPEIWIENIPAPQLTTFIAFLLHNCRELSASFTDVRSGRNEVVKRPGHALTMVTHPNISVALWGELKVGGYTLPATGYFFENADTMVIGYMRGPQWNPVAMIALFELFRLLRVMHPKCTIKLSPRHFAPAWQAMFNLTVKEYLTQKYVRKRRTAVQ